MPYSSTAARIENEETVMEMEREGMKGKRNGGHRRRRNGTEK